jgi:hypothetical protein
MCVTFLGLRGKRRGSDREVELGNRKRLIVSRGKSRLRSRFVFCSANDLGFRSCSFGDGKLVAAETDLGMKRRALEVAVNPGPRQRLINSIDEVLAFLEPL